MWICILFLLAALWWFDNRIDEFETKVRELEQANTDNEDEDKYVDWNDYDCA